MYSFNYAHISYNQRFYQSRFISSAPWIARLQVGFNRPPRQHFPYSSSAVLFFSKSVLGHDGRSNTVFGNLIFRTCPKNSSAANSSCTSLVRKNAYSFDRGRSTRLAAIRMISEITSSGTNSGSRKRGREEICGSYGDQTCCLNWSLRGLPLPSIRYEYTMSRSSRGNLVYRADVIANERARA